MIGIPRPLVRIQQAFILIFTVLGMLDGLHTLLLVPVITGVHALLTRRNLVFKAFLPLLKRPLDEYVPEDPDQQRFNQWLAVIFLALAWVSFLMSWNALGYIFSAMLVIATGLALCGFCIGCVIRYRWMKWRHRRSGR